MFVRIYIRAFKLLSKHVASKYGNLKASSHPLLAAYFTGLISYLSITNNIRPILPHFAWNRTQKGHVYNRASKICINPLTTRRRLLCLKTQFVPRN